MAADQRLGYAPCPNKGGKQMIPPEIAAIANLIWPNWDVLVDEDANEVIAAAYRIYNAGYRRTPQESET
jgi:hypothetical protein